MRNALIDSIPFHSILFQADKILTTFPWTIFRSKYLYSLMTNRWQYLRWEILLEFWTIVCYYFGNIFHLFWFQWLIKFQYEKGYKLLKCFSKSALNEANSFVDRLSIVPFEFLISTTVCVYGFSVWKIKWSRFTEVAVSSIRTAIFVWFDFGRFDASHTNIGYIGFWFRNFLFNLLKWAAWRERSFLRQPHLHGLQVDAHHFVLSVYLNFGI